MICYSSNRQLIKAVGGGLRIILAAIFPKILRMPKNTFFSWNNLGIFSFEYKTKRRQIKPTGGVRCKGTAYLTAPKQSNVASPFKPVMNQEREDCLDFSLPRFLSVPLYISLSTTPVVSSVCAAEYSGWQIEITWYKTSDPKAELQCTHSLWLPFPHPYLWQRNSHCSSLGLVPRPEPKADQKRRDHYKLNRQPHMFPP